MSNPRFQVFVSSTFRDLIDERRAVQEAILRLNHFPAGMELFPAADSGAWAIIERVIRESDYYVLIVGGRYGSTDTKGISYTEREYDYAVELGKSVVPFLHGEPDTIPAGKIDMKAAARKRLAAFRKRVEGKHHCNFWCSADDLKSKVVFGLLEEINTHPAVGWVRADGMDNQEIMRRLVESQDQLNRLRAQMSEQTVVTIDEETETFQESGAAHKIYQIRVKHVSGPPCLVTTVLESAEPKIPALPLPLELAHRVDGSFAKAIKRGSEQLLNVFVDRPEPGNVTRRVRFLGSSAAEIEVSYFRLRFVAYPVDGPAHEHFFVLKFDEANGIQFHSERNAAS